MVSSNATLIQPGLPVVIFVITLAGWPYMARIIRGQVLSLREKEFVEAARWLVRPDARIMFRHILPNALSPNHRRRDAPEVGNAIITPELTLSFLGVWVQAAHGELGGDDRRRHRDLRHGPGGT